MKEGERMADFLELKRTTSSSDSGFWINGITLYSTQGVYNTVYRCAYYASSLYNIRVGVYRNFDRYNFVFVSETAINPIDIRLVYNNVNDETITVQSIDRIDTQFETGFRNGFAVSPDDPIINITVFSSLSECLEAIGYSGGGGSSDTDIVITITTSSTSDDKVILINVGGTADGASSIIVNIDGKYSSNDTNAQGGTSIIGGGDGTFDDTSDPIPIPVLPSISTVDTGLITLFRPTAQELINLSRYLWSHLGDLEINLQKLFTNPMDYFIAFNIFPVSPLVTNARNIYIGNLITDIYMSPVANQWYEFDCGTVVLRPYWGSALDYSPNTRVQLMLPYIGSVQLNTDEVMGNQIGIKYRIDLLSGSCVAMVTVNGNVLYQFTGECAVAVPLTGADWSRIYSAVVGTIGTAITGVAGAMASGAAAGAATSAATSKNVAKATHEVGYLARSIGEIPKGVRGAPLLRQALQEATQISLGSAKEAAQASGNVSAGIRNSRILGAINNTVGQVMGAKASVSHSGTISGSAGMLGVRDAYLIVEYPNQSLAQDYKHFVGYPSNIYARLGTLSGYTEVEQVIPEGIWGTDDELAELIEALKSGVYL